MKLSRRAMLRGLCSVPAIATIGCSRGEEDPDAQESNVNATRELLSRYKKFVIVVMENRSARYAAQGLYGMKGGATKATPPGVTHTPRSKPTAHGPLVLAADDPITKVVDEAITAFKALPADQFVAELVSMRAVRGGRLPKDVFVELGDQLTPEQLPTYLKLLHTGYPSPRAVTEVISTFLFRHHEPATLHAMWNEALVPLYGSEAAVPTVVGQMVGSWAKRASPQATTGSDQPVGKI